MWILDTAIHLGLRVRRCGKRVPKHRDAKSCRHHECLGRGVEGEWMQWLMHESHDSSRFFRLLLAPSQSASCEAGPLMSDTCKNGAYRLEVRLCRA